MEQMQLFTTGMKMQHRMILDASVGGSIKVKTYAETKDLVEQMCQNEYNMSHDRNEKTPGIITRRQTGALVRMQSGATCDFPLHHFFSCMLCPFLSAICERS
jgi:hypothetical protein